MRSTGIVGDPEGKDYLSAWLLPNQRKGFQVPLRRDVECDSTSSLIRFSVFFYLSLRSPRYRFRTSDHELKDSSTSFFIHYVISYPFVPSPCHIFIYLSKKICFSLGPSWVSFSIFFCCLRCQDIYLQHLNLATQSLVTRKFMKLTAVCPGDSF